MNTAVVDVADRAPLGHEEAMHLQTVEFERTNDLLRSLEAGDWLQPVPACPDWDVRQMYLHVLGASQAGASMRENMHQMRLARKHRKRHGGPLEAGLSNVQVREREHLSPADLVTKMAEVAPVTVRKRTKLPTLMRRAKLAIDGPVHETWTLGYLVDTIYLRDMWMHRIDACDVTGRELVLTGEHDGRIVAEVVAEWARRHGQSFRLTLTGPAGGDFIGGSPPADVVPIQLDAVEFCRMVGGRVDGAGLLTTVVPF